MHFICRRINQMNEHLKYYYVFRRTQITANFPLQVFVEVSMHIAAASVHRAAPEPAASLQKI